MAYDAGQELSSLAFDKIIGGALDAVIKAQSNSAMTTVDFVKSVGFAQDSNGKITNPIYVNFNYPKEVAPYQPGRPAYTSLKVEMAGAGYSADKIRGFKLNEEAVEVDLNISTDGKITGARLLTEKSGIASGTELKIEVDGEIAAPAKVVCVEVKSTESRPAQFQDMTLKVPVLTMLPIPYIRIATTDIEFNVKINSVNTTTTESSEEKKGSLEASAGFSKWGFSAKCTISGSMANQKKSSSTEEVKKEFSLNIKVHAVQDEIPAGLSRILDILEESIVPQVAG